MRIFWLFNHPAPYKVEFFNRLGKENELTVYFERLAESGRNATFYGKSAISFHAIYGHPLKLGGTNNLSFKPLSYLKKHEEYDLIVLNGWKTWTERLAISYCKGHHLPYAFYINGGIARPKENNIAALIKNHYIAGADFYLAPDPSSKEYLIHYGAKEENIRLFPYGSLSEEDLLAKPYNQKAIAKLRSKLGVNGGRVFVSTGFFIKRKNFDGLIRCFQDMPKENTLYLIGQGPEKRSLERLIKRLGLQNNVFILPYMDHKELFRFYRACDAFVFPTHEDIYGHVVAEAMSQGLPVFASPKANAAKTLIRNGENGRIIDFDNHEEVILALTAPLTEEMKLNAIETASHYTYEASAKAHQALFESFIGGGKQE